MKLRKKVLTLFVTASISMASIIPGSVLTVYAGTGNYAVWLQSDSSWGSLNLGRSSYTMTSSGCLVTSIAMLICHSGSADASSFTPGTLVNYLNNNGGFTSGGALYWAKINGAADGFSLVNWKVSMAGLSKTQKTELMADYLNKGYAVVISVRNGGHWVALDRIEGDTVYMMDPAGNATDLYATYNIDNIDRLAIFKGKSSCGSVSNSSGSLGSSNSSASNVTELNATGKVNCSSLYMRNGAGTSNSIVTSLTKNTEVKITGETKDSAGTKWYKVTAGSKTGFVCATYITLNSSSNSSSSNNNASTEMNSSGVVNCSSLNVRNGAGTNNSIVTTISLNQAVTITGKKKDSTGTEWYAVKFTSGSKNYTGYVAASYITLKSNDNSSSNSNSSSNNTEAMNIAAVVNCSSLNMRKDAGTNNSIVQSLSKGTKVTIIGEKKDSAGTKWYQIKVGSTTGYVHSSYLTKSDSSQSSSSGSDSSASKEESTAVDKTMQIIYDAVNVRKSTNTSSSVVAVVYMNEKVTATSSTKNSNGEVWYAIKTSSGKTGYIRSDLLKDVSASTTSSSLGDASADAVTATVNADWLNVRKSAGTSSSVVIVISKGTKVTILDSKKDNNGDKWYQISVKYSGKTYNGYVHSSYVE